MAYNPGITYTGDRSIMAGLQGLGSGIAQGIAAGGQMMRDQKEENKQKQQYAKLFDSSADLMKQNGLLDANTDINSLSLNDKAEMMKAGVQKLKLMNDMEDQQAKQLQNKQMQYEIDHPWQPSFGEQDGRAYMMTSPKSAVPWAQKENGGVSGYPAWKPGDPITGLMDSNTVGIVNPKTGEYEPKMIPVRRVTKYDKNGDPYTEDVPMDVSNLPKLTGYVSTLMGDQKGTVKAKNDTPAKQVDAAIAKQFLQQAGGDKNKARELARQQGYTF